MDIRQIDYFAEVASQLNFTKAAAALHISQPSLSKAIKHLETEVGTSLLYRGAKQLELTDTGEAFLANARQVLEAFNNLTAELNDVMELKKGEIKIGIPPIMGAVFFSRMISVYKEAYPSIHLLLTEVGTNKIKQGVEEGTLDIGLVCHLPVKNENLNTIELIKDPLMLLIHREHALAEQTTVDFPDIENESFILYRQDFSLHDSIIDACGQHGFYPDIACESSQKDFMIEMVEAKLGIALLPGKICSQITSQNITAIPFQNPTVNLELGMIWKKSKYQPHAVREFINLVGTEGQAPCPGF